MKRNLGSIFAFLILALLLALPTSAASQTVILKPTSVAPGLGKVYIDGSPTPSVLVGGGSADTNNVLAEDGQFALLDPELPGPGTADPNPQSMLFLDYEKDVICEQATIQDVKVHVIWKSSAESTQGSDGAILLKADNIDATPELGVAISTTDGGAEVLNQAFGGLANPVVFGSGSFTGNISTTLTHDTSSVQIMPTAADINSQDTRILINGGDGFLGEGETEPTYITTSVDYAYLEVTYDDVNCSPGGVATTTVAPPKSGAVLTASIIGAALVALLATSLFGVKRTKLKHRASERE